MEYYELIARIEQPEWRKALIKEHGPAGVAIDGYNDYAKAMFWEWKYDQFGDWPVDSEGDLKCDGERFWVRKENGRRKVIELEKWLNDRMIAENAEVFGNGKWKHKLMYFEYIKITEVNTNH